MVPVRLRSTLQQGLQQTRGLRKLHDIAEMRSTDCMMRHEVLSFVCGDAIAATLLDAIAYPRQSD